MLKTSSSEISSLSDRDQLADIEAKPLRSKVHSVIENTLKGIRNVHEPKRPNLVWIEEEEPIEYSSIGQRISPDQLAYIEGIFSNKDPRKSVVFHNYSEDEKKKKILPDKQVFIDNVIKNGLWMPVD